MKGLFLLLPPEPGTCVECGVEHPLEDLHDAGSLFYQYKFYAEHSRWPTWTDAMAHCSEEVKKIMAGILDEIGVKIG